MFLFSQKSIHIVVNFCTVYSQEYIVVFEQKCILTDFSHVLETNFIKIKHFFIEYGKISQIYNYLNILNETFLMHLCFF